MGTNVALRLCNKGNQRLKRFIEKIPKGGLMAKFDWMRFAPDDLSRVELALAQILHLSEAGTVHVHVMLATSSITC
jgi:hypothetical protein